MGALIAPTSVRELVAQGLSPLEIKRKAEEYQAQGQILWGWPEYRFWYFYDPRKHQYYASLPTPASFRRPVITAPPPLSPQSSRKSLGLPEKSGGLQDLGRKPWRACRLSPTTPVAQYINDLPPQQRECLQLKYKMGKTNEEVAKECGREVATVNVIISRAYSRIRRLHNAHTGGVSDD